MTASPNTGSAARLRAIRFAALALAAGWLALAVPGPGGEARADTRMLRFGTGSVTGLYFPVGGALAEVAETAAPARLLVESTGGSVENLVRLGMGDLDLAIARSDLQAHAWQATGPFDYAPPFADLRSILALHGEPLTVVARLDAGVARLEDLPGLRINIGPPETTLRLLIEALLGAQGWTGDTFAEVHEVPFRQQVGALCDGALDVVVFVAGHPSGTIQHALQECDTVLVPITGPAAARLLAEHPDFAPAVIPGGLYPETPHDVPTIGPVATLVGTAHLEDEAVLGLVRAVFENLDALRLHHPVLRPLMAQPMVENGLVAPLHPGAARYFVEAGLSSGLAPVTIPGQ